MQETLREKVLALITSIRESHVDSVYLYTQGQCYAFHKILRAAFGGTVEPWYDSVEGHVYSKIGEFWYDIRREWPVVSEYCRPIVECGSSDQPDNWGKRDTRRLIDLARPSLEEAKDLTDFRPLKYLKGGLKRGELYVLNSMDGGPIWESKEPITVVDVLSLAQRKGYIGVVDDETLKRFGECCQKQFDRTTK